MHQPDTPSGTLLMPIFGLATIIGIVVICLMLAFPSTLTLIAIIFIGDILTKFFTKSQTFSFNFFSLL